jgi:peptidoglycan-associated lipoprotein
MPFSRVPRLAAALALSAVLLAGLGCPRRTSPPAPSPEAPPPQSPSPDPTTPPPELEVRAEPARIRSGEPAVLVWESRHAERVVIDQGIGSVEASGRVRLFPERSQSYVARASGKGGQVEQSVMIEVFQGGTPESAEQEWSGRPIEEQFAFFVKPVFFAYDSADLSAEAKLTLEGNLRWLVRPENARVRLLLVGHTDDRGTSEYNLALGDTRAQIVKAYLVGRTLDPARLSAFSLGEERPFEAAQDERAWALNRRVHFVLQPAP